MTEHGIIYERSQGLIDFAYEFAKEAHGDQKRKYTGEPYITHPVAVAKIVMAQAAYYDCEMIAAAILHDTIEDTDTTYEDLVEVGFMHGVANLVVELSDISKPEDGNRAFRKAMDREHLAGVSDRAKTIKLADLIHNAGSILRHGGGFAFVYIAEVKLLIPLLEGGDVSLMNKLKNIVGMY